MGPFLFGGGRIRRGCQEQKIAARKCLYPSVTPKIAFQTAKREDAWTSTLYSPYTSHRRWSLYLFRSETVSDTLTNDHDGIPFGLSTHSNDILLPYSAADIFVQPCPRTEPAAIDDAAVRSSS